MEPQVGESKRMRLRYHPRRVVLLLALSASLVGARAVWAADEAPVRVAFFTSATCPHCGTVLNTVLTPLLEEYGERLEIKVIELLLRRSHLTEC